MPAGLLAAHGPVSPETAAALAEGVRKRCAATWGIGLTGVAGPDPVDGYGPGRVYLGLSDGRRTDVVELDLPGDRATVREAAVTPPWTACWCASADRERHGCPRCYAVSGRVPVGRTWALRAAYRERTAPPAAPPLPRSQDRRRP